MKDLLIPQSVSPPGTEGGPNPRELRLKGISYRSGAELLPGLMDAIDRAGGWVLHRQMLSASALQFRLETQGRALMDLYASLVEEGLELNRDSHLLLTERCSCARISGHLRREILSVSLEVVLMADPHPPITRWRASRIV